jgi:hypothetical protein
VQVEISADGGRSWSEVSLGESRPRNSWRLWHYDWQVPNETGFRSLMVRATDSRGQEAAVGAGCESRYLHDQHCLPVEIEIR